ncbi:putative amidophosphoribosyltransferase [Sphingobacterium sp. HSC-15S19]
MNFNISLCRPNIILFDDVLTTGAHYCAARTKILEVLPYSNISGYFIARRLLPPTADDFKIELLF